MKKKILSVVLVCLILFGSGMVVLAADKVNIEIFYYKQEIVEQMEEMADAFTAKNSDISIKLTLIPNDSMTVLRTRMAGGDAPEIIQLQSYSAVREFAKAGWLLDLSNEPVIDKVMDGAKNAVTYNERLYALPMDLAGIGIIYNREIFDKYDIIPPKTFKDLRKICSKLKANDIIPFSALFRANWSLGHFITMVHTSLAGDKVLPWIEMMNSGQGSFADPVDIKQLFRIMDFYKANVSENAAEMDWNEQVADFASGKAAMMVQGLWSYAAAIGTNPELNCGFIPFPITNNPAESKLYADVDSTFAIASTISPEKTEAAKRFLAWLSTPEGIKMWVEKAKLVPTFKGADVSSMDRPFQDLVGYMDTGLTNPWAFSMYPVAVFEDACKNGAQEYIFDLKSAADVVDYIDDTWKREAEK